MGKRASPGGVLPAGGIIVGRAGGCCCEGSPFRVSSYFTEVYVEPPSAACPPAELALTTSESILSASPTPAFCPQAEPSAQGLEQNPLGGDRSQTGGSLCA